jgi:hypothetical protein
MTVAQRGFVVVYVEAATVSPDEADQIADALKQAAATARLTITELPS